MKPIWAKMLQAAKPMPDKVHGLLILLVPAAATQYGGRALAMIAGAIFHCRKIAVQSAKQ